VPGPPKTGIQLLKLTEAAFDAPGVPDGSQGLNGFHGVSWGSADHQKMQKKAMYGYGMVIWL